MVTIKDVALAAGVTAATVSNVLNGKPIVRDQTRQRVLAAMHQLHYRPNTLARSLARGRTQTVRVLTTTCTTPGIAALLDVVAHVGAAQHYQVALHVIPEAPLTGPQDEATSWPQCDGLIVLGAVLPILTFLSAEAQAVPTLLLPCASACAAGSHAAPLCQRPIALCQMPTPWDSTLADAMFVIQMTGATSAAGLRDCIDEVSATVSTAPPLSLTMAHTVISAWFRTLILPRLESGGFFLSGQPCGPKGCGS